MRGRSGDWRGSGRGRWPLRARPAARSTLAAAKTPPTALAAREVTHISRPRPGKRRVPHQKGRTGSRAAGIPARTREVATGVEQTQLQADPAEGVTEEEPTGLVVLGGTDAQACGVDGVCR